jgi:hypothetical protein
MTDIGTQPQGRVSLESRRSTRVALKVVIETQGTQGIAGHLTCEGERIRKLFDYCGRPLDSEFKHDEIGFKVYANGNQKPMRKFYYAATTTQYPKKGECFFAVEVVPADAGFKVTTFGPLRLQSGQLPEWLR